MQWLQVTVSLNHEALEAAAEILMRYGATGVEIDDPRLLAQQQPSRGAWDYVEIPPGWDPEGEALLRAWFPVVASAVLPVAAIQEEINALTQYGLAIGSATLTTTVIPDEDWGEAWKAYYKPLQIGQRLLIVPAWEERQGSPDRLQIILDPGLAFGTGNHATTRLCLELLEKWLIPGSRVLDIGCGSGILTIASAKLGASRVDAIDIDPLAISSTKNNLKLNDIDIGIGVHQGELHEVHIPPAQLLVANIVADVIIDLLQHTVPRYLAPGGVFIAGGILEERLEDVLAALALGSFSLMEQLSADGWVALALSRSP
ncbi:MAG: 50S ribosomal protein L11 methyltransferase [Symbiobacteriaceae bacterium]|nr:50S ribosomal protein L11 methyltransferase [Symbiobacteriaceae bacterium]